MTRKEQYKKNYSCRSDKVSIEKVLNCVKLNYPIKSVATRMGVSYTTASKYVKKAKEILQKENMEEIN